MDIVMINTMNKNKDEKKEKKKE